MPLPIKLNPPKKPVRAKTKPKKKLPPGPHRVDKHVSPEDYNQLIGHLHDLHERIGDLHQHSEGLSWLAYDIVKNPTMEQIAAREKDRMAGLDVPVLPNPQKRL